MATTFEKSLSTPLRESYNGYWRQRNCIESKFPQLSQAPCTANM